MEFCPLCFSTPTTENPGWPGKNWKLLVSALVSDTSGVCILEAAPVGKASLTASSHTWAGFSKTMQHQVQAKTLPLHAHFAQQTCTIMKTTAVGRAVGMSRKLRPFRYPKEKATNHSEPQAQQHQLHH